MTRSEHVRWCKSRALEYLRIGDLDKAVASMLSDLGKHDETAHLGGGGGPLAMTGLMVASTGNRREVERFITGVAE